MTGEVSFLSPDHARRTAILVAQYRRSTRLQLQSADELPQVQPRSGQSIAGKLIGVGKRLIASLFTQHGIAPGGSVQVGEDEQFQRFNPVGEGNGHSGSPDRVGFENPTAAAEAAHRLCENRK